MTKVSFCLSLCVLAVGKALTAVDAEAGKGVLQPYKHLE